MIQNLSVLDFIEFQLDGFIRIYDKTRCLALFGTKKNYTIYVKIIYLISIKSGIPYITSHFFEKMEIDSKDSLTIEKTLTFQNVIIHIKSVPNKDKNHYY